MAYLSNLCRADNQGASSQSGYIVSPLPQILQIADTAFPI